jgi:ketosteroid isomerase-like protein
MTIATVFSIQNDDLALLRGEGTLKGTGPDGKPVEMSGKNVEVARRQPNGEWLFVIDHPFGADAA